MPTKYNLNDIEKHIIKELGVERIFPSFGEYKKVSGETVNPRPIGHVCDVLDVKTSARLEERDPHLTKILFEQWRIDGLDDLVGILSHFSIRASFGTLTVKPRHIICQDGTNHFLYSVQLYN